MGTDGVDSERLYFYRKLKAVKLNIVKFIKNLYLYNNYYSYYIRYHCGISYIKLINKRNNSFIWSIAKCEKNLITKVPACLP